MVSFGFVLVHRCTTHQELDELSLIHSKLDLNLHSGQKNITHVNAFVFTYEKLRSNPETDRETENRK